MRYKNVTLEDPNTKTADGWPTYRVKSWIEFVALCDYLLEDIEYKDNSNRKETNIWQFRGQADVKHNNLMPSLARRINKGLSPSKAISFERQTIRNMRQVLHLIHSSVVAKITSTKDKYVDIKKGDFYQYVDILALMQQYGAPTRLLDWTSSPFVAAYFAVCDHQESDQESDGVVWFYSPNFMNDRMREICNNGNILECFINNMDKRDMPLITIMDCRLTDRMIAQSASFTICPNIEKDHAIVIAEAHKKAMNNANDNPILNKPYKRHCKILIDKKSKPEILRRLHQANVSGSTLFPGADGIGRLEKERLELMTND